MYVRKMFQLSSYINSNRTYNYNDVDDIKKGSHNSLFGRRKCAYNVLIKISRWPIFCYHLKSILIGLWVLLKWAFYFLWQSFQHTTAISASSDYYSCLHDKPPPCLVDNQIGLQSYVKLKVSN